MLTRRSVLQGGAAACLLSAAGPALARSWSGPLNPHLLHRARAALERKRRFLRHTDVFAIADFGLPSGEERFHLVDALSGKVTSYHVAHGRGSDPDHTGFVHHFSDRPGSNASSAGAYVTGSFYYGKYGRSLKLKGLDNSNRSAESRAIVIHAAPYSEPSMLRQYGKLGRSEGCFAFSSASHRAVLDQLGPGRLLYCDRVWWREALSSEHQHLIRHVRDCDKGQKFGGWAVAHWTWTKLIWPKCSSSVAGRLRDLV